MSRYLRLAVTAMALSTVALGAAWAGTENEEAAHFTKEAKKRGEMYFEGKISAIDLKANTFTIKKKDGTMTFQCNDQTKFFVVGQKQEAKLSQFKVEDWGRVFYTAQSNTFVAVRLWQRGSFADRKERMEEKAVEKKK